MLGSLSGALGRFSVTRQVKIGSLLLGGGNPILVQSMTNVPTNEAKKVLRQIKALANLGCDFVRVTVPDKAAVEALPEILEKSPLPVVADIHFDYRLALASIKAGVKKLRLNPGNIGSAERVQKVAEAAGLAGIPIRIGINAGSLRADVKKEVLARKISLGHAMAKHALKEAALLEKFGFSDIVLSVKSSDVLETVAAYRFLHQNCDYPLHLGITEAGGLEDALLKSGAGLGALLLEGIGDTLRISITGPIAKEAVAGRKLLQFLKLRPYGPEVISCPTCGRTRVNLAKMAALVEKALKGNKELKNYPCKVAVMGCAVNGPGEAASADAGLAGGVGYFLLFSQGKVLGRVKESEALARLLSVLRDQKKSFEKIKKIKK